MEYQLNDTQEQLLDQAERIIRREQTADFFNSPRSFFQRRRSGYYDERLIYALRWLAAQKEEQE